MWWQHIGISLLSQYFTTTLAGCFKEKIIELMIIRDDASYSSGTAYLQMILGHESRKHTLNHKISATGLS